MAHTSTLWYLYPYIKTYKVTPYNKQNLWYEEWPLIRFVLKNFYLKLTYFNASLFINKLLGYFLIYYFGKTYSVTKFIKKRKKKLKSTQITLLK